MPTQSDKPIRDHIRAVIADVLELEVEAVQEAHHFVNDLGANSLDVVEFVMRLEEELGVTFPDEAAEQIKTVGDLVRYAEQLRAADGNAGGELEGPTRIAMAADRAGFALKQKLVARAVELGMQVDDLGVEDDLPGDYPHYAVEVARAVSEGRARLGVLVCGTGIGMSIAANKIPGVRAALVHTTYEARMAREHNDANVLCLGARVIGEGQASEALETFLTTAFTPGDDGRHARRVEQIRALDAPGRG